jgi:hypothetical protein
LAVNPVKQVKFATAFSTNKLPRSGGILSGRLFLSQFQANRMSKEVRKEPELPNA